MQHVVARTATHAWEAPLATVAVVMAGVGQRQLTVGLAVSQALVIVEAIQAQGPLLSGLQALPGLLLLPLLRHHPALLSNV